MFGDGYCWKSAHSSSCPLLKTFFNCRSENIGWVSEWVSAFEDEPFVECPVRCPSASIEITHPHPPPIQHTHVKYFTQQLAIWGSRSEKLIVMYDGWVWERALRAIESWLKTTITFQLRLPLACLDLIFWENSHRYNSSTYILRTAKRNYFLI